MAAEDDKLDSEPPESEQPESKPKSKSIPDQPVLISSLEQTPVLVSTLDQSAAQESEVALHSKGLREEEALHTRGSRQVDLLWETTQGRIALIVIITFVIAALISLWFGEEGPALAMLSSLASLVVGFYFGRTNHARRGGQ